jgi:hypothetical protein
LVWPHRIIASETRARFIKHKERHGDLIHFVFKLKVVVDVRLICATRQPAMT